MPASLMIFVARLRQLNCDFAADTVSSSEVGERCLLPIQRCLSSKHHPEML